MGTVSTSFEKIAQSITAIQRRVVTTEQIHPTDLAAMRTELAGYYAWMRDRKAELDIAQNRYCAQNRDKHNSDKATERAWLTTEDGELFVRLHHSIKGLERLISALKSQVDTAQNELHYSNY